MKSNLFMCIFISVLIVFLNLATLANNSNLLTNKILDYADNQLRLKEFSSALELYSHGYKIKPLPKFKAGLGLTQEHIFKVSVTSHGKRDFRQAEDGYNRILTSCLVENEVLKEEAKRFKEYSLRNFSESDMIELAQAYQQKEPEKAIGIYRDCMKIYPGTMVEKRLKDGLDITLQIFFNKIKKQHQAGEFDKAVKGYQKIVTLPYPGKALKLEAKKNLTLAKQGKKPQLKVAYLTFDDGPSKNTLKILDILDRYKVKATFFVTGNSSKFGTEVYLKIISKGHAIGNHTFSHKYKKIYVSEDAFLEDFYELEDLLYRTVGIRPKIFRFPGGSNNLVSRTTGGKDLMNNLKEVLNSKGYQYFDWNVDSKDAEVILQDTQVIIDSVLIDSKGKQNIIVLMHDTLAKQTTPEALPKIIEGLRAQGFAFSTLP